MCFSRLAYTGLIMIDPLALASQTDMINLLATVINLYYYLVIREVSMDASEYYLSHPW